MYSAWDMALAACTGGIVFAALTWVCLQPPKRKEVSAEDLREILPTSVEQHDLPEKTLKEHIESLLVGGYFLLDEVPVRYQFCIGAADTTPFGRVYFHDDSGREYAEITDQGRITAAPGWYAQLEACESLTGNIKDLIDTLQLVKDLPTDTYERPFQVVQHNGYTRPVLRVYKDMTWFEDRRWTGPVIVANDDGKAEGIIPSEKVRTLEDAVKELYVQACTFWQVIPPKHHRHQELSKQYNTAQTTVKEFLARG
jgi:hypothetical protein